MQGGTQLRLVMRRGPQVDRAFPILNEVVTIGRDAANDIVIADAEVSRHHSRMVRQPNGALTIEDLGSTNGTYVNGVRLTGPHPLTPGDTVGLGETVVLQFQATAGDSGATMVTPRGAYPGDAGVPVYPQSEPEYPSAPAYPPPQPAYPPEPPGRGAQVYPQPGGYQAPAREPAAPPRRSTNTRNMFLAGCGCLLLLCVLCTLSVWVGDAFFPNEFWTTPPMSWVIDLIRALGLEGLLGAG